MNAPWLAWLLCVAQSPSPSPARPTFAVGIETVQVDVLVTRGGKPLIGLSAEDFAVRDSGVLQSVELAAAGDLPVNAILLLDTSGSLRGERMTRLRAAADAFVAGLRPGDQAALLSFSHRVRVLSGLAADLAVIRALLADASADGMTALNDALYLGLALAEAAAGRTVLILFSDGADNISWLPEGELLEMARASPAVVYVVASSLATGPDSERDRIAKDPREAFLRKLVDATGGELVRARTDAALAEAFQQALRALRSRYVLRYTPQGVPLDGWHPIEVKLKGKGEVITRPGYFKASAGR